MIQVNRYYKLEGTQWRIDRYPDGTTQLVLCLEVNGRIKLYESFQLTWESGIGEQIIERFENDFKRVSGITIEEMKSEIRQDRGSTDNRDTDS